MLAEFRCPKVPAVDLWIRQLLLEGASVEETVEEVVLFWERYLDEAHSRQ